MLAGDLQHRHSLVEVHDDAPDQIGRADELSEGLAEGESGGPKCHRQACRVPLSSWPWHRAGRTVLPSGLAVPQTVRNR
jgi:hypothetical protein